KVSIAKEKEHLAPVMTLLLGMVVLQDEVIKQNRVTFAPTITHENASQGQNSGGQQEPPGLTSSSGLLSSQPQLQLLLSSLSCTRPKGPHPTDWKQLMLLLGF
ncbi:hypothetical protein H1C71_019153, partial [Ictidomys tridecemlineatus]